MADEKDTFKDVSVDELESLEARAFEKPVHDELLTMELPDATEASRSKFPDPPLVELEAIDAAAEAEEEVIQVPLARVPNPRTSPWRLVPFLTLLGGDGKWYTGSAIIIGRHHLATAGHNVFFHDVGGPTRVRVYPGRSGTDAIAALEASAFRASAAWRQSGDTTADYGVIRVNEDLTALGAFARADLPSGMPLINVAGYPSGDPGGDLWAAQARVHKVSVKRFGYPVATRKGQSGGAVWLPNTLNVAGIHVRLDDFAIAIRLTQAVWNDILSLV